MCAGIRVNNTLLHDMLTRRCHQVSQPIMGYQQDIPTESREKNYQMLPDPTGSVNGTVQ
jgi:hypothetical protein